MRPIIFLDLDDVLCLNAPYGGHHAKQALSEGTLRALSELLFDKQATQHLRSIHQRFHPQYVLSTSWSKLFEKSDLVTVLKCCGVEYVADSLHPEWTTPKSRSHGIRSAEIRLWLASHMECADRWVVVDDELSGSGFHHWLQKDRQYVVLCQQEVGLQEIEANQLIRLLELRTNADTHD